MAEAVTVVEAETCPCPCFFLVFSRPSPCSCAFPCASPFSPPILCLFFYLSLSRFVCFSLFPLLFSVHYYTQDSKEKKQRQTKTTLDRHHTHADITSLGLTLRGAMDLTRDRGQWRPFIRTNRLQMAVVRN